MTDRPDYVYVASSWRNPLQIAVVAALRSAGIDHYDFRHPAPGDDGFSWKDVGGPEGLVAGRAGQVALDTYIAMLEHPRAIEGYDRDFAAMEAADTFVLVLPCGRSAHLELGWAVGAGKRTAILLEANRRFFHPLGLALTADTGTGEVFVQDDRQDREGWYFGGGEDGGDDLSRLVPKARKIALEEQDRAVPRRAALGYFVQPLPIPPTPCGCGRPLWSEDAEEELDAEGIAHSPENWCPHWCIEDVASNLGRQGDVFAIRGDMPLEVSWFELTEDADPTTGAYSYRSIHEPSTGVVGHSTPFEPSQPLHVLRLGMVGRQTIVAAS